MTKICIADYGAGNIFSIRRALERLGVQASVSSDSSELSQADGIVLPGDGNYGFASIAIRTLQDALQAQIDGGKPFLGICVGMQLLFEGSEESPSAKGIGILDGKLTRFEKGLSCPQMGWNQLRDLKGALFEGVDDGEWAYFIHSYKADFSEYASAKCEYGQPFVAAIQKKNIFATQFHPEKSGSSGQNILKNFVKECK